MNTTMATPSLFTRFLAALGVPYTEAYSDQRFKGMTFQSLFGLSHLLKDYGVANEALRISDKTELTKIPTPFLAQTGNGVFVIVKDMDEHAQTVTYDSLGVNNTVPVSEFEQAWNGIVLLAYPDSGSREPDYPQHHLQVIMMALSKWILAIGCMCVFAYFFITRHIYSNISTILLAVFDMAGLYFSYLLVQKSLGIHTTTGDKVCGVLEKGGCDSIMSMKVSKLFGVFSWSEVGFGYFGISLICLLVFPHLWPYIAVCNVCCLPYTVWSIWYQRFRAHRWCTLCVGVQSTLWLLFFCYLGGGWFKGALPLRLDFFVLIAVYVSAVLFINLILRIFKNLPQNEENNQA